MKVDATHTVGMLERKKDTADVILCIKRLRVSIVKDNGQGERMSQ